MAVDAKGLCAIIKACHQSGVSRLKFGDVEVTFGEEPMATPNVEVDPRETLYTVPGRAYNQRARDLGAEPVSIELATEQQKMLEDAELVDMQISDPVAFEQYTIDRLVHGERSVDA